MLWLSNNWWILGKVVTIESGFSVLKGLLVLREEGMFEHAFNVAPGKG